MKKRKRYKYSSPLKQKLLLLLFAGLALCLTRSPRRYFLILKSIPKELRAMDRRNLYRIIKEFEKDRLISYTEGDDEMVTMVLTELGKQRALSFQIDEMCVKTPARWDGKWRLVLFDITEKKRLVRDVLRTKLRDLGFRELQKSVHIFPYHCKDEIDFLIEFFEVRPWVYLIEADTISNEARLISLFRLR